MGVYAVKAIEMLGATSQEALERNEMMQFALIKLVEIVGEAANYVSDQTRSKPRRFHGVTWSECATGWFTITRP